MYAAVYSSKLKLTNTDNFSIMTSTHVTVCRPIITVLMI